jgi:hypothetical protein
VRYIVNDKCRRSCTLNQINLPGDLAGAVHSMYEAGANREAIRTYLAERKVTVSDGAIGRHKGNHLDPAVEDGTTPGEKKSHLAILEQIIQKGGSTLDVSSTRISPEMLMKAIEMHHKLTEGSVWEDFLSAIGAMGDAMAAEGGPETPDAVQSADEQEQGGV